MPIRFRRSIRVLPGVRINLNKRSASVSLGGRGAHVTLRPGHTVRTTVGIPGTGVSYTQGGEQIGRGSADLDSREPTTSSYVDSEPASRPIPWWGWLLAMFVLCAFVGAALNGGK